MSALKQAKKPKLVATPELVGFEDAAKKALKHESVPEPRGWRILIGIPEIEEKTAGGIIKAEMTKQTEQSSTVLGLVLDMGPLCYADKERFGDEPWCKIGDFVLIGAYKGVRFHVYGKEFRIINDDTVQAVVDDPRGYTRA
ncbi:MAG: co-chaperone GroES [Alphaproteobacteria bacterium]|nr:co-chaperone GroES [Alphaproteobacteria bacterium]